MIDVAVIGGGVSGLTVAHELMLKGRSVTVLERQVRPGGNAVSERIGDYLMEHGPSSLKANVQSAEILSSQLELHKKRVFLGSGIHYRYLTKSGTIAAIPTSPFGLLTASYLSLSGRIRLISEILVSRNKSTNEESVSDFCVRRFGTEFSEKVIDPLVGGLFAAKATELSMLAAFPALADMERQYRSVMLGAALKKWKGGQMPGRRLFSWEDGIGSLPTALALTLGGRLQTGTTVRRIEPVSGEFRIDAGVKGTFRARSVVIATQPHVTGKFLEVFDKDAAAAAFDIPAPPISVVFLGYKRKQVDHPLDGIGYLTPASEGRAVTGSLFCSTMYSRRAPDGSVSLTAYIGGSRQPELALASTQNLISIVREEYRELLSIHGEPEISRIRQWPRGLPQTSLGHRKRLDTFARSESMFNGMYLTGNYFSGPGISACLERAMETSNRVEAYLQELDGTWGQAAARKDQLS